MKYELWVVIYQYRFIDCNKNVTLWGMVREAMSVRVMV